MFPLDHGRSQAELRGTDGRHVAAGAAADDDEIEVRAGRHVRGPIIRSQSPDCGYAGGRIAGSRATF